MAATTTLGINYIVKTPGILSGAPRIADRRVGVHTIVDLHLNRGVNIRDLAESLDLTRAQIYAALAYYYDHQPEIDALIARDNQPETRLDSFNVPDAEQQSLRDKWKAAQQARVAALSNPNREMTVSEVAKAYGISTQAVREACKEGWLPARKSGAAWLIRHSDAEERWGGRET